MISRNHRSISAQLESCRMDQTTLNNHALNNAHPIQHKGHKDAVKSNKKT